MDTNVLYSNPVYINIQILKYNKCEEDNKVKTYSSKEIKTQTLASECFVASQKEFQHNELKA